MPSYDFLKNKLEEQLQFPFTFCIYLVKTDKDRHDVESVLLLPVRKLQSALQIDLAKEKTKINHVLTKNRYLA